ncbi:MAG: hypothetical protein U0R19_27215 [Bryobacteraceae bacterium]
MSGLDKWREEIESLSAGKVVLVRVETEQPENVLRIPAEFPGRAVVVRLLTQETFVRQFVQAHALNVNYSGEEGVFHFILLNMARAADWQGREDDLLAHEYGHIWLAAKGYKSPAYADRCLAIAAGDIVQHILVREEGARRGFDYPAFWKQTHEAWLEKEAAITDPPALDACQKMLLVSEWVDATLAFAEGGWERRDAYLGLLSQRHPTMQPVVEELAAWLSDADLWDHGTYQSALQHVARTIAGMAE